MKLRITTPLTVVVDEEGIVVLRAEDVTGSFGIQPGHADFLTSLSIGVLSWEGRDAKRRFCAVRGGVLSVDGGQEISVATRDAVAEDDLTLLEDTVLTRFQTDIEAERTDRVDSIRLQLNAIRQIVTHLRGGSVSSS